MGLKKLLVTDEMHIRNWADLFCSLHIYYLTRWSKGKGICNILIGFYAIINIMNAGDWRQLKQQGLNFSIIESLVQISFSIANITLLLFYFQNQNHIEPNNKADLFPNSSKIRSKSPPCSREIASWNKFVAPHAITPLSFSMRSVFCLQNS